MQRDERAYLNDILESCAAIERAIAGLKLDEYRKDRLTRSAVEREFIIIGEAIAALSRVAPHVSAQITQGRRVADFRNQPTHEYPTVDDAIVWLIAEHDVPVLKRDCRALLAQLSEER